MPQPLPQTTGFFRISVWVNWLVCHSSTVFLFSSDLSCQWFFALFSVFFLFLLGPHFPPSRLVLSILLFGSVSHH
ncbi:hypothetical protein V8F20_002649 [Naviculisporaceae sp. PSN 640]